MVRALTLVNAVLLVRNFTEKSGHQRIAQRVVRSVVHLLPNLFLCFLLAAPKSELQKLGGPPLLGRLLLEDVLEQVSIPLDQPLTVCLAVLDLLFAVALDPLHQ